MRRHIMYAIAVGLSVAIVFGPLRMLYRMLIPWWVYGTKAAHNAITVVGVDGRVLTFSNGDVVRDDALAGLTLLFALCAGITLVVLTSAAQRVARWQDRRPGNGLGPGKGDRS